MKNLVLVLAVILVLASCKKKSTSSPSPANPAPTTPTSSTISNGVGSNANSVHGVMQAQKYTVPGFGVSVYESRAAFSANAQPLSSYHFMGTIYTNTGINAGVLKLNSTSLKYDLTTQYQENRYVDTVSTRNYSAGVTWSLSANASFSSFNTTVSRGFPNISNTNFLPASISKSAGCTFTIGSGNYSNTDSLLVLIVGSSGFPVMKHLAGTATSVAFTANDLSILSAGSNYVMVFGVNYSNMTVSGKKYIFIMEHDISANVAVNP